MNGISADFYRYHEYDAITPCPLNSRIIVNVFMCYLQTHLDGQLGNQDARQRALQHGDPYELVAVPYLQKKPIQQTSLARHHALKGMNVSQLHQKTWDSPLVHAILNTPIPQHHKEQQ